MSSNKDFKKRRREDEMDDREQKRRRQDHEDQPRSYNNNYRTLDRKPNNNNYNNRRGQSNPNNRNSSKNYADRNYNTAYSPKNNNQPQYRRKELDGHNRNIEKKEYKKKIAIHLISDNTTQPARNNKTMHFNFVNNNRNNNQPAQTPQQPKVSSPSTNDTKTEAPAPPLPGYYYDPDINRYFKVPPTGTVMYKKYQEALKKAEDKDRKQKEETQQREEKERLERGVNISILSDKYKSPLSTIIRREAGRSHRPQEFMSKSLATLFKRIERRYNFPWPLPDTECYDMVVQNNDTLIFGLRDGQFMIDKLNWRDNDIYVKGLYTTESSSISSVGFYSKHKTFYSSTILGGGRSGELKLYDAQLQCEHVTKLRKGSMWCHQWSSNGQYISMGISKGAMVLDTVSTKVINCFTEKSDVFAQAFNDNSNILLNGSRDGRIRTFDIRQHTQRTPFGSHAPLMKHESSITCLKLLKDDNYLVANSINGVINVWDRRVSKVVTRMEYSNQMTSNKFSVDPSEEFVLIGGQDNKIYSWNLRTGDLIHTLGPYPTPIKSLVFGRSWIQDQIRVPGFWTFLNNRIEFYGISNINM